MVGVRLVRMRLLMSKGKPLVMIVPAEAAEIMIDKRQSKQLVDLALLASIVNLAIFNARNGPKWAYVIAAFESKAAISYFAYGRISPPNGAPPLAARGSNDPCLGIEIRIQGMES